MRQFLSSCAGYRIAVAEMVLTLGNLLRCFDPVLAGPLDLEPRQRFVQSLREEVKSLKLKLRLRPAAAALTLDDDRL